MKRLLLVRHAHARQAIAGQRDLDRPLDARGVRHARQMAARLGGCGLRPQLLISSTARRALETARAMAGSLGYSLDAIETDDTLYTGDENSWITRIGTLPAACETVLLVGHNPVISSVVTELSAGTWVGSLPPGGVASLAYAIADWAEVMHVRVRDREVYCPQ